MGVDLLRDGLLRASGRESPSGADATPAPVTPAVPEPGSCELCGAPAAASCVHCERRVCLADHWTMFGLCRSCLTPEEVERARAARLRPRPDLGIKWVEE